jgi:hypothetical protein
VNDAAIEDLTGGSRLVAIPWRDEIAKTGKKLKIGWCVQLKSFTFFSFFP